MCLFVISWSVADGDNSGYYDEQSYTLILQKSHQGRQEGGPHSDQEEEEIFVKYTLNVSFFFVRPADVIY